MPRIVFFLALSTSSCRTTHVAHRFDNADAWAAQFEAPERSQWQKPDEVISALQLTAHSKVADIGSATGYFAVRLARVVHQGHVYGMDVESSMVEYLNKRAADENVINLTSHVADFDDAKIPEPVDLILLVNTYHHLENRPAYFKKLQASLKRQGRIAIVEWSTTSPMGPSADIKVSPEQIQAELREAGFTSVPQQLLLPEQSFLVFALAGESR